MKRAQELAAGEPRASAGHSARHVSGLSDRRPCRDGSGVFRDVRPGEIAIDCGAHVGRVTAVLAERGAEVYAFEPNPHAFAVLAARFGATPTVHCVPKAVSTADGNAPSTSTCCRAKTRSAARPARRYLSEKGNVDPGNALEVETVDLDRFVVELGRPVAPQARHRGWSCWCFGSSQRPARSGGSGTCSWRCTTAQPAEAGRRRAPLCGHCSSRTGTSGSTGTDALIDCSIND